MTTSKLITMFLLALSDAINPTTIGTTMIVISTVRRKWHTLIFICTTYLFYLSSGVIVYLGIDKILKNMIEEVFSKYAVVVALVELAIAVAMTVVAMKLLVKLIVRLTKKESSKMDYLSVVVKMTNPGALFILAITTMAMELPTSFPYWGYIGILIASEVEFVESTIYMAVYCFLYVLPLLGVFIVFEMMSRDRFKRFENGFRRVVNLATEYVIIIALFVVDGVLFIDGIGRLT